MLTNNPDPPLARGAVGAVAPPGSKGLGAKPVPWLSPEQIGAFEQRPGGRPAARPWGDGEWRVVCVILGFRKATGLKIDLGALSIEERVAEIGVWSWGF